MREGRAPRGPPLVTCHFSGRDQTEPEKVTNPLPMVRSFPPNGRPLTLSGRWGIRLAAKTLPTAFIPFPA
jgi:hypothetical protein